MPSMDSRKALCFNHQLVAAPLDLQVRGGHISQTLPSAGGLI